MAFSCYWIGTKVEFTALGSGFYRSTWADLGEGCSGVPKLARVRGASYF